MTKKKLNPEVRFKGFTEDWSEKLLDEEVVFFTGLTYSPANIVKNNGTLVLRSSNVKKGRIVLSDNVFVNSDAVNCDNVKVGDIIVVVRNGSRSLIGKHAVVKKEMEKTVIGAFMTGIRPEQSNFINSLLDTNQFNKEIEKNLGATINQITTGAFKKMSFMFPKPSEQKKIGYFFQNIDRLITLHQKKYDNLVILKKAMLYKMFPKNGAKVPEIRFKGFIGDWEKKKLGNTIIDIVDNRGKNPKYYSTKGIPIIDNVLIKNNFYPNLKEATRFIDDYLFENFIRKYNEVNDTLITLVGNGIGNITLFPDKKCVIIQNTLGLRFSNNKFFMFFYLLSINKKIKTLNRGMAQPSIRQDELLDVDIFTPIKPEEEEKIALYFKNLDKLIRKHNAQLIKLKNIKKACFTKMFVPQD